MAALTGQAHTLAIGASRYAGVEAPALPHRLRVVNHRSDSCDHAQPSATVSFSLTGSSSPRLRRAAQFRRSRIHRLPLGAMLAPMLEDRTDCRFPNLRWITCRMSSHDSSSFSQDGASGKAGAFQAGLPSTTRNSRKSAVHLPILRHQMYHLHQNFLHCPHFQRLKM